MKNYIIIAAIATIAAFNALYLTKLAYSHQESFCDINQTISCSAAINNPDLIFFGIPFPVIALVVYPIIILIALFSFYKKKKEGFYILRVLALGGILFNSYIIFNEYKMGAFCALCAVCSVIIITIFTLSHTQISKYKSQKTDTSDENKSKNLE